MVEISTTIVSRVAEDEPWLREFENRCLACLASDFKGNDDSTNVADQNVANQQIHYPGPLFAGCGFFKVIITKQEEERAGNPILAASASVISLQEFNCNEFNCKHYIWETWQEFNCNESGLCWDNENQFIVGDDEWWTKKIEFNE